MARLPRNVMPGLPQHIIHRGNNRQAVFFAEGDYRLFNECIDTDDLRRIREGTERGEIIGNEHFRAQIAEVLGRRVEKFAHGGDRKSETFLNQ